MASTGTAAAALARPLRRASGRRIGIVSGSAAGAVAVLFGVALLLGPAALSPGEVVEAVTGRAQPVVSFVVWELRMPRALAAVVVGACLGAAGAVFQSVLRNPLASPDVLGVTASAGAVGVAGVLGLAVSGIALTGLVAGGSIVAAVLIGILAWNRGLHGMRLILVGVGFSAFATAITGSVLTRAEIRDVSVAYTWLVGSLNGSSWAVVGTSGLIALAVFGLLALQARSLRGLEHDDSTAAALGVHVQRTRIGVLLTAVVLAAIAVGASGPIGFVALMAPQIARRLVGPGSISLVASAAVGAALVSAADLIAQYAIPGIPFPVGVVTGAIGAPYLAWLLTRSDPTRPGDTR
ncbi:MAG: iron ABC transporter permease [Naasia sp.]